MAEKKPASFARRQVIREPVPSAPVSARNSDVKTENGERTAEDLKPEELAAILGRDGGASEDAGHQGNRPASRTPARSTTSSDASITEKEFRAYMAPNDDAYVATYEAMRSAHGGMTLGWSWACLFMGPVWLAYRKLWLPLGLFLILTIGGGIASALDPATFGAGMPLWLHLGVTLALTLVAKSLCVNGAYRAARRAEALGFHGPERLDYMEAAGGTSRLAALVTIFIYLAYELVTYGLLFGGLDKLR